MKMVPHMALFSANKQHCLDLPHFDEIIVQPVFPVLCLIVASLSSYHGKATVALSFG